MNCHFLLQDIRRTLVLSLSKMLTMGSYASKRMLGQSPKYARYLPHQVAAYNLLPAAFKGKHDNTPHYYSKINKEPSEDKINTVTSETKYTNKDLKGQEFAANSVLHQDFKDCKCKFGKFAKIVSSSDLIF